MAVVVGLLLLSGASMVGAPVLLRRAGWQTRRPRLALGLWCTAFVTGLAAAALSLAWAVETALAVRPQESGSRLHLLAFLVALFARTGLIGVGGLASLALARAEPLSQEHRRLVTLVELLVHSSAYRVRRVGGAAVIFVTSQLPIAVSLPGRPHHRIVLTSRMEDEMTPGQLRAVIEHERAHLMRRHAWIIHVARLNAACLPRLHGAREFESAVRLLVELIADDAAARVCGRAEAAGALTALARLKEDEGLMLRARRVAAGRGGTGARRQVRGVGALACPTPGER